MKKILIISLTALVLLMNGNFKIAKAEANPIFEMVKGGSIRMVEGSNGLRFRLKMNQEYYDTISSNDKIGMLIFPEDYLITYKDVIGESNAYINLINDNHALNLDLTNKIYYEDNYYYGNGVISNILKKNYDRSFVGIGYHKSGDTIKYATFPDNNIENVTRAIAQVAKCAFDDEKNEYTEKQKELLQSFYINSNAENGYLKGSGRKYDPYIISTNEHFNYFINQINSGNSYTNTYFKLNNNIENVTQIIGSENMPFKGIFDGYGYSITVNINSELNYTALFAYNNGTIQNLILKGDITSTKLYTAGVVAKNNGIIKNVINEANVTGIEEVGGLSSWNRNIIENCTNKGKIIGNSIIGGISSRNYKDTNYIGKIISCINEGEISSTSKETAEKDCKSGYCIGGIVGIAHSETKVISCTNKATIIGVGGRKSGSKTYDYGVGGIIGSAWPSIISDCHNEGIIRGYFCLGGIVGSSRANITDCTNIGRIWRKSAITSQYCGGIVGFCVQKININNCVNGLKEKQNIANYGDMYASKYVGGIVGYDNVESTIEKCINHGLFNVSNALCIGGIAGTFSGSIIDCTNYGNITAGFDLAGICGWVSTSKGCKFIRCHNKGALTLKSTDEKNVNKIGNLYGNGTSYDNLIIEDCDSNEL